MVYHIFFNLYRDIKIKDLLLYFCLKADLLIYVITITLTFSLLSTSHWNWKIMEWVLVWLLYWSLSLKSVFTLHCQSTVSVSINLF